MNFFKNAIREEQKKRHLNMLLTCYLTSIVNTAEFKNVVNLKNSHGYSSAFRELYMNVMNSNISDFFKHIKQSLSIDDELFQKSIGLEFMESHIKTPNEYYSDDNFLFLCHIFIVASLSEPTKQLNEFVVSIGYGLNYDIDQMNFITLNITSLGQKMHSFDELEKIISDTKFLFIKKFGYLPKLR